MRPSRRVTLLLLSGLVALGGAACANWTGADRDGAAPRPDGSTPAGDGGGACDPSPPLGPGDQCEIAIDLGDLSDVAMEAVTVTGNGIPVGRTVWYRFRAVDDPDPQGDSFHVDVRFQDNPLAGYEMDIHRGSCDAADRICEHIGGPFDWYTDQPATDTGCSGPTPCGEGDCSPQPDVEGVNVCDDDTSVFYVAVRRKDGLASCDTFVLQLSNGVVSAP